MAQLVTQYETFDVLLRQMFVLHVHVYQRRGHRRGGHDDPPEDGQGDGHDHSPRRDLAGGTPPSPPPPRSPLPPHSPPPPPRTRSKKVGTHAW